MEYLVLAIILYFILRTFGNLVRLMGGEEGASSQGGRVRGGASRQTQWEGPSPRQRTGAAWDEPTFWGKDVEDATWRDLDEGADPQGASH